MDIELPAVRPNEETIIDEDLPLSNVEYLNYRAIEQHGWNLDDEDLFEKAAETDLDRLDYGVMEVERGETLLRAAEDHGLKWPFQCRSATCAMCIGVLTHGEAEMDMNLFLEDDEIERKGMRLTCVCAPISDDVQIVFNAIRMPYAKTIAQERG
jgi:ferredoxin